VSGENYIMKSSVIYSPHQIFFGDQIEKNEIGGSCSTYGERRGVYRAVLGKPERKRPF